MTETQTKSTGRATQYVVGGVLILAALGAVTAFFFVRQRNEKRRDECACNLYTLSLAVEMGTAVTKDAVFGDILDKDGKPLLSWRVRALNFLEEQPLYDQFHLNEPWDSPHNSALLAKMPAVFRCPSDPVGTTTTPYQVLTGPATLFPNTGGAKFTKDAMGDEPGSIILIVEAAQQVPWTKPADVPYERGKLPPILSRGHGDGASVVFVDGTVRSLPADADEETVHALVTPNGRESVSADRFPINQSALAAKRRVEKFAERMFGGKR